MRWRHYRSPRFVIARNVDLNQTAKPRGRRTPSFGEPFTDTFRPPLFVQNIEEHHPTAKMEVYEGAGHGEGVLDLSRLNLNNLSLVNVSDERKRDTKQLYLSFNRLASLSDSVCLFSNLEFLDISNNGLSVICEDLTRLTKLRTLIAKNNRLDEFSIPKEFGSMPLEVLNFSGNRFEEMPAQFMELQRLQSLSLGGNRLKSIPGEIENLTRYV